MIATSYPLLEVFWTMLIFFAFVIWLWMLFVVIGDLFRRKDVGGLGKTAWILVLVLLPYFGVFIYLIAEHKGLQERTVASQQAAESQFATYVQDVAGSCCSSRSRPPRGSGCRCTTSRRTCSKGTN